MSASMSLHSFALFLSLSKKISSWRQWRSTDSPPICLVFRRSGKKKVDFLVVKETLQCQLSIDLGHNRSGGPHFVTTAQWWCQSSNQNVWLANDVTLMHVKSVGKRQGWRTDTYWQNNTETCRRNKDTGVGGGVKKGASKIRSKRTVYSFKIGTGSKKKKFCINAAKQKKNNYQIEKEVVKKNICLH